MLSTMELEPLQATGYPENIPDPHVKRTGQSTMPTERKSRSQIILQKGTKIRIIYNFDTATCERFAANTEEPQKPGQRTYILGGLLAPKPQNHQSRTDRNNRGAVICKDARRFLDEYASFFDQDRIVQRKLSLL
ncbi:hypothetical protein BJX65DRAFT_287652 [Aspergillus insuetus]